MIGFATPARKKAMEGLTSSNPPRLWSLVVAAAARQANSNLTRSTEQVEEGEGAQEENSRLPRSMTVVVAAAAAEVVAQDNCVQAVR